MKRQIKFKTLVKNNQFGVKKSKKTKKIDPIRLYTEKQLMSKINIFSLGLQHRNLWRIKKKASIDHHVNPRTLEKENKKKENQKKKNKRISYLIRIGALKSKKIK